LIGLQNVLGLGLPAAAAAAAAAADTATAMLVVAPRKETTSVHSGSSMVRQRWPWY